MGNPVAIPSLISGTSYPPTPQPRVPSPCAYFGGIQTNLPNTTAGSRYYISTCSRDSWRCGPTPPGNFRSAVNKRDTLWSGRETIYNQIQNIDLIKTYHFRLQMLPSKMPIQSTVRTRFIAQWTTIEPKDQVQAVVIQSVLSKLAPRYKDCKAESAIKVPDVSVQDMNHQSSLSF